MLCAASLWRRMPSGEERGGGGGCVNTELTLERLENREVETGRGGDEGG